MSVKPIIIDCYGHASATSLDVECRDGQVRFLFSDCKSSGLKAHYALYVDYTATAGRDYLRYSKGRRVALLCEPNSSLPFVERPNLANRFARILTHDARLLERGKPYIEMPFGTSFLETILTEKSAFNKTKLVSMIGSPHANPKAGHVLRNEVIETLASRTDVDRFGKGVRWIDSKLEGLAEYAFSIAMENCSRDFYFSEKIIDCLLTDTVPIYCGCAGIGRYFDLRGLIVFETLPQLLEILDGLSWEQYRNMLPFVQQNRARAISMRWATRQQLFERVGDQLLETLDGRHQTARVPIFRLLQDMWRKITIKTF